MTCQCSGRLHELGILCLAILWLPKSPRKRKRQERKELALYDPFLGVSESCEPVFVMNGADFIEMEKRE